MKFLILIAAAVVSLNAAAELNEVWHADFDRMAKEYTAAKARGYDSFKNDERSWIQYGMGSVLMSLAGEIARREGNLVLMNFSSRIDIPSQGRIADISGEAYVDIGAYSKVKIRCRLVMTASPNALFGTCARLDKVEHFKYTSDMDSFSMIEALLRGYQPTYEVKINKTAY